MAILVNIVRFKLVWLACVVGAGMGYTWLGPIAAAAAIVLHVLSTPGARSQVMIILASGVLGIVAEGMLIASGLVSYATPGPLPDWFPPIWLIAMWLAFGTLMTVSFAFLERRLLLAGVMGALLGPLAYDGGAQLGGMTFSEPVWVGLGAVALMWAVSLPLLVVIAARIRGHPTLG